MIADAVGVSKSAVYHQCRIKDEIVLDAAEAEQGRPEAVDALLVRLVELARRFLDLNGR